MNMFIELLQEQLLEYDEERKILEKEIIRKFKSGEDFSEDVKKAYGLKLMQEECVKMMITQRKEETE